MSKKIKVGFVSLGCSKNRIDTEVMLHLLDEKGYEITTEEIDADVIIINTCAFIESAKKEAIDNILDIAWLKENRNLKGLIVTGCLAERYRNAILDEFPEVDAVLGVGSIHNIVEAVGKVLDGEKKWIFPFSSNADAVFDSGLEYELSVLKRYVAGLLEKGKIKKPDEAKAEVLSLLLTAIHAADPTKVPGDSILRETIGGSLLEY